MIMLSQLARFGVVDRNGATAAPIDFSLALLDDDHPPVTAMYYRDQEGVFVLPWDSVTKVDRKAKKITVKALDDGKLSDHKAADGEVLLIADVLDALIIDLENRSTTRANDLQLNDDDAQLRLEAVDTGLSAMLRRLTRGIAGPVRRGNLHDWKYVEFLRGNPSAVDDGAGYRMRIGRLPAGEIAQIIDYIPYLHAAELLKLLPNDKAADVLEAMSIERQLQVFEELDEELGVELLKRMASDHAADLIGRLDIGYMKTILTRLPNDQSGRIVELLRYPGDTVGGMMINDMLCLVSGTTIEEARRMLGERTAGTDFINMLFVVEDDKNRNLLGTVTLHDLLSQANDERRVEEIMNPYIETLRPLDPAFEAAYRVVSSQLTAMPVMDDKGRLLGAVTFVASIPLLVPSTSTLRTVRVFS